MNRNIAIETDNLTYAYGGNSVLKDVGFLLHEGEYMAVIGPNGGGKTTLVKLLLGILKPQTGSIQVFGRPADDRRVRLDIGYVPQRLTADAADFPATVREIVESGRTPRLGTLGRWTSADDKAVEEAMRVTDVADLAGRVIGTLSGGQRQRAFIARALATKPRILILDEPTVGVDALAERGFSEFLKKANRELGLTIVFVTHDVEFVSREATSVLCLNHELVCHGRPGEFLKEDFLVRLYGREVKLVEHEHHDHADHGGKGHHHA